MSNQPLVSIIIPTYNRAHLIGETLDSVLAQTYTNWECIVVDDGSADATESLLKAYLEKDSRFQYHKCPDRHLPGGNGARNYGFELSKGKFVMFLDSDDLFIKTAVTKRVENALLYKCDMLINNSVAFKNEMGDLDVVWNIIEMPQTNIDLILRFLNIDMPWCTNSVTWNSEYFKKHGGWDESLTAWQDWELHCRILFLNPKLKYIPYAYDNYFRESSHLKIGNSFKSKDYFKSLFKVIDNIEALLRLDVEIRNDKEITYTLKVLILKIFIKFPILYGYYLFPLRFILKPHLFKYISIYEFSKCYLLEIMGKSSKLRTYIIQKSYYNYQKKLSKKGTHLEYRTGNLKSCNLKS